MSQSTLQKLQAWYARECDGDWEHSYGVTIDTLDNPGWSVKIDLLETYLFEIPFTAIRRGESEDDAEWLYCSSDGSVFVAACGTFNLEEALEVFLAWAEEHKDASAR